MEQTIQLTTIQRLAVQAAVRDLEIAKTQMAAVYAELGLDPTQPYRLDGDRMVAVAAEGAPA